MDRLMREELIRVLVSNMINTLQEPEGYAEEICTNGFVGFSNMTLEELQMEYLIEFGEEFKRK